jgi:hypothetical protein
MENFWLPSPRINLTIDISPIIKTFQTVAIAEQTKDRLNQIKKLTSKAAQD